MATRAKPNRQHLTKSVVDAAQPYQDGKRDKLIWDTDKGRLKGVSGFGLKVRPSGHKTFVLQYRFGGRPRRYKIGNVGDYTVQQARAKAGEIRRKVDDGVDPLDERRARTGGDTDASFRELAELYMQRYAKPNKKVSSCNEDQRQIDVDLLPAFGDKSARAISKADVIRLLDDIVDRGAPVQANRTRALLSKILNFGLERDLVASNPVLGVPRPVKERPRDRVLSDEELSCFLRALESDGLDPVVAACFKLKVLTAQRDAEVRTMRWEDIEGDWWTIPETVTKNRKAHRVPLSPQVMVILKELAPLTGDSEWVLASGSPRAKGKHIGNVHKAGQRLREAARVRPFTGHDLRRTAASGMAALNIEPHHIGQVLNHSDYSVTRQVYIQYSYDDEKRRALESWGQHVEALTVASQVADCSQR